MPIVSLSILNEEMIILVMAMIENLFHLINIIQLYSNPQSLSIILEIQANFECNLQSFNEILIISRVI